MLFVSANQSLSRVDALRLSANAGKLFCMRCFGMAWYITEKLDEKGYMCEGRD